jgi:signal peptidase I
MSPSSADSPAGIPDDGPDGAAGEPTGDPDGAARPQETPGRTFRSERYRRAEAEGHATVVPRRPPRLGIVGMLREAVIVVAIALVLSLLVKTFLVQAFYIPSVSMENTLLVGDRVVVSKLTPGPFSLERGEVVVFTDPGNWLGPTEAPNADPGVLRSVLMFVGLLPNDSGNHLIKRVIGLPGDHVTCCDDHGRVTVNGVALDEPYLYPGDRPSEKAFDKRVPAGMLWVMGDHRAASQDSRFEGFVPMDDVTGRAMAVVWPFDRADWLGVPTSTFSRVPAAAAGASTR